MKPSKHTLLVNKRRISRFGLALFFIIAGSNHFRSPETYLAMMPAWLPAPSFLNLLSGMAEIAGAIGIVIPKTRRAAGFGLILLLIAVFPANLHVAMHGWPGTEIPRWILIARLPFQILFIAWVCYSAEFPKKTDTPSGAPAK